MVSKTSLFVTIGIALGVIAGIVIGLASYPVTTEEKAQGSSMMDNQSMQSTMMDSMSGNQSMMSDDQPFNPRVPIMIPLIDGYYNGSKVFFIHTEVSAKRWLI
jgi:hypothetical protein